VDGGRSNFDLTLWLSEDMDSLTGSLEYNEDLFVAATVRRMLGHFQTLLECVVANPDQRLSMLPMLSAASDDPSVHRASLPERGADLSPAKQAPLANNDWEVLKL
jgi:non-ribosomal peptide synthetase component F